MPRTKNLDLTQGIIWKQLLLFLLPIAAGTLFQQFYSTVDAIVVGRFLGSDALAAVGGSAAVIVQLVVGIFTGLSSGATVVISHGYGADDQEKLTRAVHTSIAFSLLGGIVITVLGILLTPQSLVWLKNPQEIMADATLYLRWYFVGTIPMLLFNMGSGILRAVGDSKRPLYYLMLCCLLNIVLDLVFVAGLHFGVEGAAIATFISQAVGGVLPVFYFLNKCSTSSIHLGRAQWNGGVIRSACINGSSELMTNLSMSLVNILYNYQLLRFAGENGVAAYGVIMYAAFLFVAVFVGYAVGSAPIVSYHYGARNHAELNNLYSKSLRLIGVIAVVMTALSMLVIPYVARIFVGYDAELLALTSHAFRVYALNFFLMGFNVYGSSFFTALGDGVTSALISFLRTLLFQLLALIFLPMVLGIEGVWLAVTAAEAGALCVTVLMFITKDKVFHYRKASC